MIADVDKDGSGAIDFDEFVHMMTAKIGERDTKEELMKAFHIIDQDNNVMFCSVYIYINFFFPLFHLVINLFFFPFACRDRYLSQTLSA